MNDFGRLLLALTGVAISVGTSVLVMQHGWGVEPKSWGWILGVNIAGFFIAQIFVEAAKRK